MKISSAIAWIVGSLLIIPGTVFKLYEVFFSGPQPLPHYVCRLITTGPQREALSSSYLAELMELSADRPIMLAQFDRHRAEEKVRASVVIKEASLTVIKPDTVYIDYTVRKPIALLGDFENTAVDEEAITFPVAPFFSPKKLPEIYLGIKSIRWGEALQGYRIELAQKLLKIMLSHSLHVQKLDVSQAFASSLGKREVVVILEENGFSKFLRLTPKNFAQEMSNYLELSKDLSLESQVIDLRIPQLAFIEQSW